MKHFAVKQHVYPRHQQHPSKSNVLDLLIFSTRPPHNRSLAGCLCVSAIPQSSQDVLTHLPQDQTLLAERDWTSTVCFEGLLEKVSSLLKEHDSLTLKTSIWANQMASLPFRQTKENTVGPNTQHVAIAHQHLIHLASCQEVMDECYFAATGPYRLTDHKLLSIPKYSREHLSDHSSKSLTQWLKNKRTEGSKFRPQPDSDD